MDPRRVRSVRASTTELQDLPDDLLIRIALAVDTRERRTLLPVLSRRWAGLLQGPGPAWAEVKIKEVAEFPGETWESIDSVATVRWFSRRAGSVRRLRIGGCYGIGLPACLVTTVLMSQATSLRELKLNCGASMLSSVHFAVLVALPSLESLMISVEDEVDMAQLVGSGAEVMRTLSLLPALKTLSLDTECLMAPAAGHLSLLQSPTLTELVCRLVSGPDGTLALGALPALVSCKLFTHGGGPPGEALHVPPAAFSGAAALTRLGISNYDLQLAPRCFSGLIMLEELEIYGCRLTAVPAALSGVGRTLRRLQLGGNTEMELEPHCFSGLITLEELSLSHCGLTAVTAALLSGLGRTLRRLDLSYNLGLQLASDCFSGLSMLEELSLHKCGLTAVPAALSGVGRTLRRLELFNNPELQLAPHCFSGLSRLEELDLGNCGLTAVTKALSGVGRTLRRLNLRGNCGLQLAPDCFSGLSMLEELCLMGCKMTAVPAALSGVGRTLRRLDLGDNPGLLLAPNCFSSLSMLEELDLAFCGQTAVPAALSEVARTLRRLDLVSNTGLHIDQASLDILLALLALDSLNLPPDVYPWTQYSWTAGSALPLALFIAGWKKLHEEAPA